jgi:dTDP-4-amino-4,6-dideoxygalactose transaminase
MSNPHQVTRDFERALCEYTGAPYAVAVTSCTMALLLAVAWCLRDRKPLTREVLTNSGHHAMAWEDKATIEIPKRTYVGVPMSIIHAGGRPVFRNEDWHGMYQLRPLPVWDSARWLTSGMYGRWFRETQACGFQCVSFHASKILGDTQGGAILHDNVEADAWLRRARFDGRIEGVAPKDDRFEQFGWHCYLSPDVAARLLWKLSVLPKHNEPLPPDDYPDLSLMKIFQ